jgi:hypothetical protein
LIKIRRILKKENFKEIRNNITKSIEELVAWLDTYAAIIRLTKHPVFYTYHWDAVNQRPTHYFIQLNEVKNDSKYNEISQNPIIEWNDDPAPNELISKFLNDQPLSRGERLTIINHFKFLWQITLFDQSKYKILQDWLFSKIEKLYDMEEHCK